MGWGGFLGGGGVCFAGWGGGGLGVGGWFMWGIDLCLGPFQELLGWFYLVVVVYWGLGWANPAGVLLDQVFRAYLLGKFLYVCYSLSWVVCV